MNLDIPKYDKLVKRFKAICGAVDVFMTESGAPYVKALPDGYVKATSLFCLTVVDIVDGYPEFSINKESPVLICHDGCYYLDYVNDGPREWERLIMLDCVYINPKDYAKNMQQDKTDIPSTEDP